MTNYLSKSITEIHALLKNKTIKPIDLVMEAFEKIEASEDLNAFITLDKENALNKAKELENQEIDNVLFGIPVAIKDNIVTKGLLTTAASKILSNFEPVYDATVMKLIHDKKMIVIGKTNMDEFAMGSSNQTSFYGPVKNPWNKNLVPGGSSGGSAAAVSANLVPLALGTDTGGSIRQPASFCGIVGMKPTYGRVSRYGVIAFSSSLDQVGTFSKNVYDNALFLNAISQKDDQDLTSFDTNEDFTRLINQDIKNLKIAIPNFYVSDLIDEVVRNKFKHIVDLLTSFGCVVDYIDIKHLEQAVPLYQVIALGEASSNLARFDGIRYGYSYPGKTMEEVYTLTRKEGFGAEVKRRIMVGSFLLSGKNADKYYYKALEIRQEMSNSFKEAFNKYDLIIGPTTTTSAYELGKDLDDAVKNFLDDILTIPVNMAGLPGLSLPIGFDDNNLPIGMQIIANRYNEAIIYQLASFIEKELNLNLNQEKEK